MADVGCAHGLGWLGPVVMLRLVDEVRHVQLCSEGVVVTFLHLLLLVLLNQCQPKLLSLLLIVIQNILNDLKVHSLLDFLRIFSQMLHIHYVHGLDPRHLLQIFQAILGQYLFDFMGVLLLFDRLIA